MKAASARDVFRALLDAEVRFIVVGGLAVNVHGLLRVTADIDLVIQLEAGNVARAFAALEQLGYRPVIPVTAAQFADATTREGWVRDRHMRVLGFHSDRHPDTPVDIFASEPFPFEDEHDRAVVRELAGVGGVRVVSLATLQRMKQQAGRPRDLADLEDLRLGSDRGEDPNE